MVEYETRKSFAKIGQNGKIFYAERHTKNKTELFIILDKNNRTVIICP